MKAYPLDIPVHESVGMSTLNCEVSILRFCKSQRPSSWLLDITYAMQIPKLTTNSLFRLCQITALKNLTGGQRSIVNPHFINNALEIGVPVSSNEDGVCF